MESKEELKKEKVKEEPKKRGRKRRQISKDNPGRIANRPVSHLKKEDFMQLEINLLHMDKVRLEMANMSKKIESNQRENHIIQIQYNEKKNKESQLKKTQVDFIADIKKRTGIDVRGKSIDFIAGEVLSDNIE